MSASHLNFENYLSIKNEVVSLYSWESNLMQHEILLETTQKFAWDVRILMQQREADRDWKFSIKTSPTHF